MERSELSGEYELSADMRLVELQRRRLELPERPLRWTQDPQALEETFTGAPRVDLETPAIDDALVIGSLHVAPAQGLIPGALVTVALVVENVGAAPAAVHARLTLSLDAGYRPGTTTLDGRALPDFDEGSVALGEAGVDLGTIGPGERRRLAVMAKLGLSLEPFRVTGFLDAAGAPVLGVAPVEIARRRAASTFAQAVAQQLADEAPPAPQQPVPTQLDAPGEPPAYELEPEEELVYEAADAALALAWGAPPAPPATPAVRQTPEPPATTAAEEEPPPPATVPEPPAPLTVPEPPEPIAEPEPPAPEAVPEAPILIPERSGAAVEASPRYLLWCTIDSSTVRFLGRVLQDGAALGLLGHFLVANALIVRFPSYGAGVGDALGLAAFSAEQASLLNRLMLQARMKRAMSLESYATAPPTEHIARIGSLPMVDEAHIAASLPAAQIGSIVLYATLDASELAFLQRTASTAKTPPFVRNRQIAAALLPRRARGTGGGLEEVGGLLAAYAEASLAAITRFFVQLRLKPSLLPTAMRDPALETAAGALLTGLRAAL